MINEQFLNGFAGYLNGESFTVPGFLAHGTDSITVGATDTTLSGEQGTRDTLSSSRDNNVTSFIGLRSGAVVVNTSTGDTLYSIALFDALTSGTLLSSNTLPGLLQSTAFDIETTWDVSVERD